MPHVYSKVDELAGHALVGTGDCVALVKAFAPGLQNLPTTAWRPAAHVVDVATSLQRGTAIATFEGERYGNQVTGQHAAFFLASAGSGIWVMDQWKNDPNKPLVSVRHIRRKGKTKNGAWADPSNNAEAFYVIK